MSSNFPKLLALLLLLTAPGDSTKWLVDSPSFDNPAAWLSEYLPCSLEEVVFPEIYSAILPLPKQVDVRGFVLPKEGALLLSQDSTISLGGEPNKRDCENGGSRKAYLKPPKTNKWLDPLSWRTSPDVSRNPAIPDMERVPCNNESVIIQRTSGPLSIDLENVPYMRLGQLSLAGSLISKEYLINLVKTDVGQILFKNSLGVTVEYYRNDNCGCHKDFPELIEPICHNVVQTCERPHCLSPITTASGMCCAFCGSVLKFEIEQCDDSKVNELHKIITKGINDENLKDKVDYHISYMNSQKFGNYLQVMVVDRDAYSGQSVSFVQRLNSSTAWSHRLEMVVSGRPYNPNITFGSILLIVLCLIFVSVVGVVIFAHYAPDNRYLNRIPHWIHDPRRWRAMLLRSPFIFARFDNVAPGGVSGDAGDMQENIIMGYDAESGEVRERSFDNPMFEERAKGSQAKMDKDRPREQKVTTAKLENVTLVDAMEGEEEQELTEITLESVSTDEDSDEEKETKE